MHTLIIMHLLNTAVWILWLILFDAELAASLSGGYHIPIKLRINLVAVPLLPCPALYRPNR